jgi:hypothetical protein
MAGADDFIRRTRYLESQVGDGDITAGCTVDQPYAQNQHENLSFEHTVGRARYLGDPLMENSFNFLDGMSRAVITEEGSRIREEMRDIAEDLADLVFRNAPRDPDVGDVLANSGSPFVSDDGVETYRRPPIAPRRRGPSESGWEERPPKG